jgi:hypothetical protein
VEANDVRPVQALLTVHLHAQLHDRDVYFSEFLKETDCQNFTEIPVPTLRTLAWC